ncbi:MAG: recombinase XerD [Pirellula sp.]|nr:recombinase XerD [Pirellula sp.]
MNSLPSYRRHKASGQAVVTLNGNDHYLGPHGSKASRDEYDRLIAEWLANGRRTVKQEQAPISMEELLAAFWEHAQCYYKGLDGLPTKEVDAYRQAMKPLRSLYGRTDVESFGPLALKTVREQFISADFARSHVNKQIGRIKRVFKWGVENELVSPSVLQGLQAVAGLKLGRTAARETAPVEPVSEALVGAVEGLMSRQVWTMIQLQVLTGMRSGEVTSMRGCDITQKGTSWEYRPQFHKTLYRGKERVIFLGPQAQELLSAFLKSDPTAFIFSPKDALAERNATRREQRRSPMTPSQMKRTAKQRPLKFPGERYTSQSYGRAIAYAVKKAKVAHWSPHQLRHTAATRIREKFGLEAAQVILGHSRADVTQIYAEANRKKAADIMGSVG